MAAAPFVDIRDVREGLGRLEKGGSLLDPALEFGPRTDQRFFGPAALDCLCRHEEPRQGQRSYENTQGIESVTAGERHERPAAEHRSNDRDQ